MGYSAIDAAMSLYVMIKYSSTVLAQIKVPVYMSPPRNSINKT